MQDGVNAGLPTHALREKISASRKLCLLSFPMTGFHRKSFGARSAHGGGYRSGFSPDSLFTDYAQSSIADTSEVYLITKQYKPQNKFCQAW